ncbi:MAG: hypothetical protein GF404_11300 [candidate division Zixibacteria bacterium]|nr:hypothetical protein [candidate division Zixibacteria bacterium]
MQDSKASDILVEYDGRKGSIISLLETIQAQYGYLPREQLEDLSEKTGRSLVDIYGVATFYKAFSLTPRGQHLVSVCLGTACHVKGGPSIAKEIQRQLNIKPGETTEDKMFTLEVVNCLGACAIGPVVVIDGHYFPKVSPSNVKAILDKARTGLDIIEVESDERVFPIEVSCSRCNHSLMNPDIEIDGHPAVVVTVSFKQKHGWLALSSLYGSYNTKTKHEIPEGAIVNIFCPYCHSEMIGSTECSECGAPMVPMIVRGGGMVQICTRQGCRGHMLDLSGVTM